MPDSDLPASFRKLFFRKLGAGGLMVLLGGIMAHAQKSSGLTIPFGTAGMVVWVGAMTAVIVYSVWVWRCPACSTYLGRGPFIRNCRTCGVELNPET